MYAFAGSFQLSIVCRSRQSNIINVCLRRLRLSRQRTSECRLHRQRHDWRIWSLQHTHIFHLELHSQKSLPRRTLAREHEPPRACLRRHSHGCCMARRHRFTKLSELLSNLYGRARIMGHAIIVLGGLLGAQPLCS